VLVRQRPDTASGVIFMTVEDENGAANVIVWPKVYERYRRIVLGARMIAVKGVLQREKEVIHVIARRLIDLTPELLQSMKAAEVLPSADAMGPAQASNLWRHPRDTQVLPKGRNFQ
jgi:error-prone DNA polymerase